MAELEQVEKLRERANVTFAEAKQALDEAGGDMLEALINLEKQGKVTSPAGGGFFSSGTTENNGDTTGSCDYKRKKKYSGESFLDMLKRFGRFCLKIFNSGNTNFLEAYRNGVLLFSIPVTVVVILLLFFFWATIVIFAASLFFGLRYRFSGTELGKDSVNKVMDSASDAVENVKKSFTDGADGDNGENGSAEDE